MTIDSTPAMVVDENGCEVDTDGDGVVDSMDDCPATAVNVMSTQSVVK